jgi:glutathione synthase/RimK-type ligase-like ATP-grasp enzyme/ribosomal protein S18 acetylase RimI-like enzyme
MKIEIRKANQDDIDFLIEIENKCFPPFQQSSRKKLKNSIHSDFQEVLIAEKKDNKTKIGALVLFKYNRSLRIYSIAILPDFQKMGFGEYLLKYVQELANRQHYEKILIEVHATNKVLINWYRSRGFVQLMELEDYYCEGEDAIKMEYKTNNIPNGRKTSNIIVINQPQKWTFPGVNAKVISVREYINDGYYQNNTDLRIFNLCSSYRYQSYGYYVSLLASARGQRIIPSTITIRDFRILNVIHSAVYDIQELIDNTLNKEQLTQFTLPIYFGQSNKKGFSALAMKLYQLFEAPLFKVEFIKHDKWMIKDMRVLTLAKLPEDEINYINECAKLYFNKKRFSKSKVVNFKYDLAVLVNPQEKTPPSSPEALLKFKKAANKKGIYLEFLGRADIDKINEFDALFIRETTSVNDHTYEFSRMAYAEGLVVIDDPWSILKCSNKIYQNEIFKKNKILTPQTNIFSKNIFDEKVLNEMNYPLILKKPDSAFSKGMAKVENKEEAIKALNELFKSSDMIVCQEFLYSPFDWRIGVLDNKAIFACKYYMSKEHWQIYNWKKEDEENAGEWETLAIETVPELVVQTALKAAALIGDGLYGVDLKMINDKVYIVEVNDNPNIDADVEDLYLKDKLYELIIDSIYNRIEIAKNIQKIDFRSS